jgi:hypothetical protein
MPVFQKVMIGLGSPLPEAISVREAQPYDLLLKYLGILTLLSISTILFIEAVSCKNVVKDPITALFVKTTCIIGSSLIVLGYLLGSVGGPSSIYRYTLMPSIYLLSLHAAIYSDLLYSSLRRVFTIMMLIIAFLSLISGIIPVEELNVTKTPYSPSTGEPFKNDIITSLTNILDVKYFTSGYYVIWIKLPFLRGAVLKNIINNQGVVMVEHITETDYMLHSNNDVNIRWKRTEECIQEYKIINTFYVLSSHCKIQLNVFWNDGRNVIVG